MNQTCIFDIDEILLCIYVNASIQEKIKLSQLSAKYNKLVKTFNKIYKIIFPCIIDKNRGYYINTVDNYLYLSSDDDVILIDSSCNQTVVKFRTSACIDERNKAFINNGIIIYKNNQLKQITFLPKYTENILHDNIQCSRIHFNNNTLYVETKKEINNRPRQVLEYYNLIDGKLEYIDFIILYTTPNYIANKNIMCIMEWYDLECKNRILENNKIVCQFYTHDGNCTMDIIDNYVLRHINHNNSISCSLISTKLKFNVIYKAPKHYYINPDIKELKLPLTVLILKHYNDDNENNVEDYKWNVPEHIIVILANKTWNVIHEEPLYNHYKDYFYVINNTVFMEGKSKNHNKIMAYNFDTLIT